MKYYSTVIFDFDGTIADSMQATVKVYEKLSRKYNLKKIPKEELNILRTKKPLELLSFLNIPLYKAPFLLMEGRKLFQDFRNNIEPFHGIAEVIHSLKKKYILGILTSNSEENVRDFLKEFHLDVFEFIHNEKNLFGKDKALRKIIEERELDIEKTLYIGDEVRDIEGCQKAGVSIVSVAWGFNEKGLLSKSNPTYLIDYPEDLLKIL